MKKGSVTIRTNMEIDMARKPMQKRAKHTVDAIIESSFILLKNNGLDGVTTKKIAEKAGVSVGSVYEYFKDKNDIYHTMVQVFVDENIEMLKDASTDMMNLPIADVIRDLLYRYKEILQAKDGRYLVLLELQGHIDTNQYVSQAEPILMEMIMKYAMHNPQYLKINNLLTFCYVGITAAVFSIIRYLNQPNTQINFDTMVDVIVAMIDNHIKAELSNSA